MSYLNDTDGWRMLWIGVLKRAYQDALKVSVSRWACESREWWVSEKYAEDRKTFCDLAGLEYKRASQNVYNNIKKFLVEHLEKFEEKRYREIAKVEARIRYFRRKRAILKVEGELMVELNRLNELPVNGYGLGEPVKYDDVRLKLLSKIGNRSPKTAEGILSHRIAVLLRNMVLDGAPIVWFHVPNEAGRSGIRYGMALNAMGRIAGAPDYVVSAPKGVIFFEAKTEKGKLSEAQKDFQKWCEIVGTKYIEVNDAETVEQIVREHM